MKHLAALALLSFAILAYAAPEYPQAGPDVYDTKADGAAQIAAAAAQAQKSGKRVLVDMGANWCSWCRSLHHTFQTDAAVKQALDKGFVLVLVDVNAEKSPRNAEVIKRYGNPVKLGLPVLLVLDANGKLLTTQNTADLEDGKKGHDRTKVIAFLEKWTAAAQHAT